MTKSQPPFALFIRGPHERVFTLSDELGFAEEMTALAVSVFEDGPGTMHVQALYDSRAQAEAVLETLDVSGLESFIVQLPDEDWTAKSQAGLPPVEAGRFFVFGSHDADKIPQGTPYPIQIDAGLAFGTGHHGTTKGCLLAFDRMLDAGKAPSNVFDLGCGAGILAIAAAKALKQNIFSSDIDPDAVMVTDANAALNGVSALIDCLCADGANDDRITARAPFDLIFANILAGPLLAMAGDIATITTTNGNIILSGILNEQAQVLIEAFEAVGFRLAHHDELGMWTTLTMVKEKN